ncbi:gas vesicle protein GvpO [Streptomyces sp. 8N706]|uniref:gas vesicle protein GvpO n=1 Tax=Streptomyces sp. 8N706 TaxID=3457416 RepID=UPI003FD2F1CE
MSTKDEDTSGESKRRGGGGADDRGRSRHGTRTEEFAPSGEETGRRSHPRRVSAPRAMQNAADQLAILLGTAPESVSALKPTADGWEADVEVLELARVPDTTSVMATYRVILDPGGELMSYERRRRYARGQIDSRG